MRIHLKLLLTVLLLLLFVTQDIFAKGVTLLSLQDTVEIAQEFTIYFKVEGLDPESDYNIKGRIGPQDSLIYAQTYNQFTDNWELYDGTSWDSFPILKTDPEGSSMSAKIKVKTKTSVPLGKNAVVVRIKKVGSGSVCSSCDSEPGEINIVAAPTPTSTPIPSNTPSAIPTQTNSSTPTRVNTSTPTPSPTTTPVSTNIPTPTIKPTSTPTSKPSTTKTPTPTEEIELISDNTQSESPAVLGESIAVGNSPTPTMTKSNSSNNLPKIFIGTGALFLVISGGLFIYLNVKH